VIYDESVSGDLTNDPPHVTLQLAPGVSSIKGSQFEDDTGPGGSVADFDEFRFVVPAGTQVTNISYAFVLTGDFGARTSFSLFRESGPSLGKAGIDLAGSQNPVELFGNAVPLGAGSYLLTNDTLVVASGQRWSADYTFNFTVSAIPEPSIVSFISISLVGWLAGYRRRRTASMRLRDPNELTPLLQGEGRVRMGSIGPCR